MSSADFFFERLGEMYEMLAELLWSPRGPLAYLITSEGFVSKPFIGPKPGRCGWRDYRLDYRVPPAVRLPDRGRLRYHGSNIYAVLAMMASGTILPSETEPGHMTRSSPTSHGAHLGRGVYSTDTFDFAA